MAPRDTKKKVKKIAKRKVNPNELLDIGMSEEIITKAEHQVRADFDKDRGDRAQWEQDQADLLDDWSLTQSPKDEPWENCSNVTIPLTTVTVNQFHARSYDAFFGSKELVTARPCADTLKKIMEDTTKEMKEAFDLQQQRAIQNGEQVPPLDVLKFRKLVLEETWKRASEYSSAVGRFMSAELANNMPEFESNVDVMILWLGIGGTAFKKTVWCEKEKRVKSVFVPANKLYIPFQDDREHPSHYIHRYSLTTNEIIRGIKKGRFRDIEEFLTDASETTQENKNPIDEAAQNNTPNKQPSLEGKQGLRDILEYHGHFDIKGDNEEVPVILTIEEKSGKLMKAEIRTDNGKPDGEEMHHFTKYPLIPIPGNAYGIGFGQLLKTQKSIIETLFNQTIDNLSLNNCPWGIIDKNSAMLDGGDIEIYPGKWNEVSANDKPLAQMVYIPRFQQVNPMIMQMIEWLYALAREVGSVSEVMTGQTNKVEAATAVLAKIEQGTKVFSVIMKRVIRQASAEIQKIYKLNQIHRKDYELLLWMPANFSKYFKMKFDVFLNVDPANMNRVERLKKSEMIYQTLIQNPLVLNDPVKLWWVTRNWIEALEDNQEKVNRYLGAEPPKPPEPQIQDKDQVTELSDLIRGGEMKVLPQQDHLQHIQIMDNFQRSMHFDTLDKFRKNAFEQHMRDHQSLLYMIQEADKEIGRAAAAKIGG